MLAILPVVFALILCTKYVAICTLQYYNYVTSYTFVIIIQNTLKVTCQKYKHVKFIGL